MKTAMLIDHALLTLIKEDGTEEQVARIVGDAVVLMQDFDLKIKIRGEKIQRPYAILQGD